MTNTRVQQQTRDISYIYEFSNGKKPSLVEYIEYIDKPDKGYRVESKSLKADTIHDLEVTLNLKLITVHPTLDRTLIATYHFRENRK